MYSKIGNVNILTSLLLAHHVSHAVVCPGSRNAPIVHNLNVCGKVQCYPVTDERSAGFFALGIAQATASPVVVCVTSGTALLNLAPAVAEAYYQHVEIVVVSADRPGAWIGQLDGQTLPQPHVFGTMVNKSVNLPLHVEEPTDRWLCNRLVNEALLAVRFPCSGPVHINVPIAEPLFDFSVPDLPAERVIHRYATHGHDGGRIVAERLLEARRPMVVFGECHPKGPLQDRAKFLRAVEVIHSCGVILSERLCSFPLPVVHVDEAMVVIGDDPAYLPDLVVYLGDTVVSKRLRAFLRKTEDAKVVMVNLDGEIRDVTMHVDEVVAVHAFEDVFYALADRVDEQEQKKEETIDAIAGQSSSGYPVRWKKLFDGICQAIAEYEPPFSQMATVRYFEQQMEDMEYDFQVHYANSSAIRLGNRYAQHPVYCNRGVNGIDGSLSVAAGSSAVSGDMVFCVIGDLSFFYDQNALWNTNLGGNLRIILLNNGKGGIFGLLPGLEKSEAFGQLVSAAHRTTAKGICIQNDIGYLHATDMQEMRRGVVTLLTEQTRRPMLLEVFTDAATDNQVMRELECFIKTKLK